MDNSPLRLAALEAFLAAFKEWKAECTNVAYQKVLEAERAVEEVPTVAKTATV